jgi:hypothetical protein
LKKIRAGIADRSAWTTMKLCLMVNDQLQAWNSRGD